MPHQPNRVLSFTTIVRYATIFQHIRACHGSFSQGWCNFNKYETTTYFVHNTDCNESIFCCGIVDSYTPFRLEYYREPRSLG